MLFDASNKWGKSAQLITQRPVKGAYGYAVGMCKKIVNCDVFLFLKSL